MIYDSNIFPVIWFWMLVGLGWALINLMKKRDILKGIEDLCLKIYLLGCTLLSFYLKAEHGWIMLASFYAGMVFVHFRLVIPWFKSLKKRFISDRSAVMISSSMGRPMSIDDVRRRVECTGLGRFIGGQANMEAAGVPTFSMEFSSRISFSSEEISRRLGVELTQWSQTLRGNRFTYGVSGFLGGGTTNTVTNDSSRMGSMSSSAQRVFSDNLLANMSSGLVSAINAGTAVIAPDVGTAYVNGEFGNTVQNSVPRVVQSDARNGFGSYRIIENGGRFHYDIMGSEQNRGISSSSWLTFEEASRAAEMDISASLARNDSWSRLRDFAGQTIADSAEGVGTIQGRQGYFYKLSNSPEIFGPFNSLELASARLEVHGRTTNSHIGNIRLGQESNGQFVIGVDWAENAYLADTDSAIFAAINAGIDIQRAQNDKLSKVESDKILQQAITDVVENPPEICDDF